MMRATATSRDYAVTIEDDVIQFRNRSGLTAKPDPVSVARDAPFIDPETMHDAKNRRAGIRHLRPLR